MIQKVYLAGGFKTNWQKVVIDECSGFHFFNPREKEADPEVEMPLEQYSTWDLHFLKQSDIVFVYAERTNKSCIGLSVESGFARGLGKTVVLVLEPGNETINDKSLSFIKSVASITFETLEEGISYLKLLK